MKSNTWRILLAGTLFLALAAPAAHAGEAPVALRSGIVEPGGGLREAPSAGDPSQPQRWVVRFSHPTGLYERGALVSVGARIEAPLPGQAYLVTLPAGTEVKLAEIPGVDWAARYRPENKLAPEITQIQESDGLGDEVIVLLHLFADADAKAVAAEMTGAGLQVEGVSNGTRFDRIVLLMTARQLRDHRWQLAERNDVFWVGRRYRRILTNDTSIWVGQSGLYAGQATPVFDQGIYGEGQIAAVLDTGVDADLCYFRDGTLGLPPTNINGGTTIDSNQRKIIAVDFLDPAEDPANVNQWDTQGHGTHVAGILAGDDLATPILHDAADGNAPGAKLVIQDAGYAADACGDLPGIGCPVTDLIPVFQQAYDQGARTHSNSWNDNENAAVQNNYTDASEDVDEFMWNHPDFLIVFACGNHALGGLETMGSPSTAKNTLATGGTYKGENAEYLSDISAWGPTDDGRIKPDVVFPGASIHSADNDNDVTTNNCASRSMTGTSMAAPGISALSLLVREYFVDGWYPTGAPVPADAFTPSAALVKAMVINSAVSITGDAEGRPITIPSGQQGWGRPILDNCLHFSGDERGLWVDEDPIGLASPSDPPVIYQLEMEDTGEPLKVTLAWTDYPSTPAAATHLINDLDLRVDGPSGSFHGNFFAGGVSRDHGEADHLNNVEQVLVEDPLPGNYSIQISAHAIPSGPQPYSIVVSGGHFTVTQGPHPSYLSHVIDDSGPQGNGDGVLDPGETATVSLTLRNAGDADATSVIGHLFSAYPDLLKVYRATTTYDDMPVGAVANSASPHYSVTLEPGAACGQVLGHTMSIEGDGFEVGSGFSVDVGLYQGDYPSPDTPLAIPANSSSGVSAYVEVPVTFPLIDVDATVNIAHGDISELKVLLYRPGINPPVYLHYETGAGVSGLHTTYDELTEPDGPGSLDDFVGSDPQGRWRLKVVDSHGTAVPAGTLESWTLHLRSSIPFNCNPVSCGQAIPAAVGNSLSAQKTGSSDVQVSWSSSGAADYNVWRSADAAFRTAVHRGATGGSTSFVDSGAQNLPGMHYYAVRSVNSCRWESP